MRPKFVLAAAALCGASLLHGAAWADEKKLDEAAIHKRIKEISYDVRKKLRGGAAKLADVEPALAKLDQLSTQVTDPKSNGAVTIRFVRASIYLAVNEEKAGFAILDRIISDGPSGRWAANAFVSKSRYLASKGREKGLTKLLGDAKKAKTKDSVIRAIESEVAKSKLAVGKKFPALEFKTIEARPGH